MRAVVLVGGFGTRLRPLTTETPKQMLPVVGVTMFERVVANLGAHGITEAVISLGFRPDAFTGAFPDGRCGGVDLHYAIEPEPLDTGGAIAFAARDAAIDDTFLVVNGDVLTDVDYGSLIERHRRFGGDATLHLIGVDDPSRYGVVPTRDDGSVIDFVEKPAPGTEPSNFVNAGSYVMEPAVLDRIPVGARVSIERVVFPEVAADRRLFAVGTDDYWIDAGTPASYIRANLDLTDGSRREVLDAVADDARIDASAKVHNSVIGAGVVVGADAEVRDSVVMSGAVLATGARVDGSIVASGARVGAGAAVVNGSILSFNESLADHTELRASTQPARDAG